MEKPGQMGDGTNNTVVPVLKVKSLQSIFFMKAYFPTNTEVSTYAHDINKYDCCFYKNNGKGMEIHGKVDSIDRSL
jgi:hypothetical protein